MHVSSPSFQVGSNELICSYINSQIDIQLAHSDSFLLRHIGLLGLGIGASLLADVMLLLAIPYITLYYIYSFVLRCHLKLSREMYLLFRGKWQDDSSENFVLEHVIVGVLLLTPLLFLLPTVLVYYALWLILFVTMKVRLFPPPKRLTFPIR